MSHHGHTIYTSSRLLCAKAIWFKAEKIQLWHNSLVSDFQLNLLNLKNLDLEVDNNQKNFPKLDCYRKRESNV